MMLLRRRLIACRKIEQARSTTDGKKKRVDCVCVCVVFCASSCTGYCNNKANEWRKIIDIGKGVCKLRPCKTSDIFATYSSMCLSGCWPSDKYLCTHQSARRKPLRRASVCTARNSVVFNYVRFSVCTAAPENGLFYSKVESEI